MARHDSVLVPASKMKYALTKILKEEGFISNYEVLKAKSQQVIKIYLRYTDKREPIISGLRRVSKPGLRVYVQRSEIPRVYGGLGIAILSTPRGVMTGRQAWRQNLGGELLCCVW
jgi:small subunit ribosomal protein S8